MLRRTYLAMTLAAAATATTAFGAAHAEKKSILETAAEAGSFTTLAAAIDAVGLTETLEGDGPFTVFAPTDDAFAALPEGTVETLLMEENLDQLTAILTYHVVPGAVMSGDLSDGMEAETVQGGNVTISIADGTVMVDDATVTTADIEASNGVIHVIDQVIMPDM
ncbi:Immunogenic protein MPT70 precursor [Roseivivax sp. THAF40]|uniref:fasciclin domain-containing protein n=1 Tax=unclassified Roseivivax TaxID=2639302 RepID=UPI001268208E|nr:MULTISPECIES: fasciclin domain-containing protein [unclassified Roseivivax]QFS81293.1 Immunogenic protein MPT70 precursor [Roseivivax sp. THAF197b]QFT45022.1 Immunogenic protein MPT70 precursor [Roseivivax sp. THAF40]